MNNTDEKYKVNGNVENQNVNGKVTVYPNNINKVSKKAVIAGFRTSLKELKRKFGTISIYDKQKTVKAASLILAGTITLTSLTGCTFGKKEEIKDTTTTETVMAVKEETQRIIYTVEFGDSLWSIASKYCDTNSQIVSEKCEIIITFDDKNYINQLKLNYSNCKIIKNQSFIHLI